ncbi:MAG TPA: hypothetical protein VGN52_09635 [Burkholderiales bacterium]|jgi:hypothetical protein
MSAAPEPSGSTELHLLHRLREGDAGWANALLRLVQDVPLYGAEKSFKLSPGELLSDRFLIGLAPKVWPQLRFEELRAALAMPPASFAAMMADLKRANFLGLAYEGSAAQRVFKAYVEFPVPAQRLPGPAPGSVAAHLIYHGYKWDPDRGEDAALTRYWWAPELTADEIRHCLARHQAGIGHAAVRAAAQGMVEHCMRHGDARRFQYIEAREGAGSRVSYDLNVYAAQRPLGEVADLVRDAARALGVDTAALDTLLAESAGRMLGHVSAGTDRRGRDFLTVYYEQ